MTVLTLHARDRCKIDLRRPMDAAARGRLRRAGVTGPVAIITAFNPGGETSTESGNARRNNQLRAMIALHGVTVIEADGGSPDGKHVEPGFAAALSKADARRISRFFDQSAFFWYDGRRFWIEPSTGDHARLALPLRG